MESGWGKEGCEEVGVGGGGSQGRGEWRQRGGGWSGQSALLTTDKDGYLWVVAHSGCLSPKTLSPPEKIKHT